MDNKCIKCGGEYSPPKYETWAVMVGWFTWETREALSYICKTCGYIYRTKCNN